ILNKFIVNYNKLLHFRIRNTRMSVKPQTKLMKLVCKRAALMDEPYRQPPWTTHQMSHVNKKESNVHKVKQTFKSINKIKKITQQTLLTTEKVRMIEQYNFLHAKYLLIDNNCFMFFYKE
ncbi:unnamed protein product, partial [Rotaria sp. Silwood2]